MGTTNTRSDCGRGVWVAALALALFVLLPAADAQRTYPEEVHRLVVERLRQRGGGGAGAWGEWSSWAPCSRSCGGGVSVQSRECLMSPGRQRARARRRVKNDSGGSRCVGLYKRFQLCNVQACPGGYSDFRREQCASFNKTPFNRRFYTWEPYYDTPDSCALNCRAVGLSFYATLNQTVIDGTACGLGASKICVAGMCMELGCDGVLGSGKRLDSCGQCGGDNSTCRVIAGIFSRVRMPYGYNIIATLPAGATNITIQHTKPSTNYLALRLQGGDFFINGNWAVNGSGNYPAAGTVFAYQRPEMYLGDKVVAAGPLAQPVDVMLFFQSSNPGIKYEYRLPMSSSGKGAPAGVVPGSPQRPRHRDNPLNPFVPGGPAARTPPSGTPSLSFSFGDWSPARVAPGGDSGSEVVLKDAPDIPLPSDQALLLGAAQSQYPSAGSESERRTPSLPLPLPSQRVPEPRSRALRSREDPARPRFQNDAPNPSKARSPLLLPGFPRPLLAPRPAPLPPRPLDSAPKASPSRLSSSMAARARRLRLAAYYPEGASRPFGRPLGSQRHSGARGFRQRQHVVPSLPRQARSRAATLASSLALKQAKAPYPMRTRASPQSALGPRPALSNALLDAVPLANRIRAPQASKHRPASASQIARPLSHPSNGFPAEGRLGLPGPVNDARSSNGHGNSIYANRRRKAEEEEKKKKERQGKKERNKDKKGNKKRKRYEWKVVGFSSCTATCGGGSQTTRVVCVKRKKGNEVPAKHCADHPKPPEETVRCNLRPCPAEWVPEEWGPCSVSCGLGVQTRSLSCKIRLSQGHIVEAAQDACTTPPSVSRAQVCELPACDSAPAWRTGEWGACSAQCGLGTRYRTVTCETAGGAQPPHLCPSEEKPSNQELCDMGSCATDTWFISKWGERCSEECGDGVQRRRVHCSGDALDNQVTETSCNPEQRPATTRACTSDRGCGGKWFTGPWGECDSECGPGRRARSVVCVVWARGQWRITTDVTQCKADPRPDTTQGCTRPCGSEWYTSEWSQCSASCGSGVQRREVKCLSERQEPALDCTSAAKPDTRQPCNTQSCHQEQADESNTSASDEAPQASADSSPGEDSERKSSGNVSVAASWRHPHGGAEDSASDGFQIRRSDSGHRGSTLAWASSGGEEEVVRADHEEEEEEEEEIGHEEEEEDEDEGAGRHSAAASGGRRRRPGSPVRPGPAARPGGFPQHRPGRPWRPGVCIDRMKNCHLVYKARLCRLKYYNKLCCETCTKNQ